MLKKIIASLLIVISFSCESDENNEYVPVETYPNTEATFGSNIFVGVPVVSKL